MTPIQIEAWALRVIDQVKRGQPNEDSLVELKAVWPPDVAKTARQIAAHANTARGQPLLWLMGVDEKTGVTGVDRANLANWYPQIEACFDGLAPDLRDLNVPVEGKTVVALLFDTTRAPFVVTNQAGGAISHEVPWRQGTRTRSARREELVRLLVPHLSMPDIEVLAAKVRGLRPETTTDLGDTRRVEVHVELYITPRSPGRLTAPLHRTTLAVIIDGTRLTFSKFQFASVKGSLVQRTTSEAIIDGPGVLGVQTQERFRGLTPLANTDAVVELNVGFVGIDRPAAFRLNLPFGYDDQEGGRVWGERLDPPATLPQVGFVR
jgi:hypothetical protein